MTFRTTPTNLKDVIIFEPDIFHDERGFFLESFNQKDFKKLTGKDVYFVQDNHSFSQQNVLRGLHYQIQHAQGKLIRVISGEIFDIAVDLRKDSETFGAWEGFLLSSKNKQQLWIPPGFAHGFLVMSHIAETLYKTTDYWHPEHERTLAWDDPTLKIEWPLCKKPILSKRDMNGHFLNDKTIL
jgi:dTDP-4-dehydrorhamnose 3,5-epimerase